MGLESFLAIAFAFFVVTVSPGPANIAACSVSISQGRRAGLIFGLGLSLGLAFWGVIAATGLGAVLQTTSELLFALKILGGLYLLWLAFQSARSAIKPTGEYKATATNGRWFLQGLLLNLTNPKAVVAWMAALAVGLDTSGTVTSVWIATVMCMLIGVVNYTGYAITFSTPQMMSGYNRFRRWIEGTVAVLFSIAGVGLIRSAFAR